MKINTTYFKLKERYMYGSSRVGVRNSDIDLLPLSTQNYSMTTVHYSIGSRTYELSNQLPSVLPSAVGNVLSVVSDKVIPVFPYSNVISEMRADIRVAQDYSPFGVTLDGRDFVVSEGYRFGYQGSEKDDEVKGEGNSYTTHFRQLDPRLGRWLSIDPKMNKTPWESPYISMGDNPIIQIDPMGDDKYKVDREGNVSLKRKTNKEYDKIVGRTKMGIRKSVKIEKGILGSNKHETLEVNRKAGQDENGNAITKNISYEVDIYHGPQAETTKLFEFFAKTTKVEWGHFKFGKGSIYPTGILTTSHDLSTDVGGRLLLRNDFFKYSDFNGHDHIHPGGSKDPSGYLSLEPTSDIGFAKMISNMFLDKVIQFRIYTKDGLYTEYGTKTVFEEENQIIVKPTKQ